jgi:hypothetical protein
LGTTLSKACGAVSAAITTIALAGCGNALDSRASDLAGCLEDRGIRASANGHGTEGISVDGHFRDIEYAEVHVEAGRGKAPPIYNVQMYNSGEDGRIWIQGLQKPDSPRQAVLLDGGRAVMFGFGVAEQQPVVEDCLKAE